jgi:hypothetical protein
VAPPRWPALSIGRSCVSAGIAWSSGASSPRLNSAKLVAMRPVAVDHLAQPLAPAPSASLAPALGPGRGAIRRGAGRLAHR